MDFENPPADPVEQFIRWFDEAKQRTTVPNPNAMSLATVDPDGKPSARIVLLKHFDSDGAVFFSNYRSAKAQALEAHPVAALLVHWDELHWQVRMRGGVSPLEEAESDAYFASRPIGSQIGAWASDQSQPAASRAELDQRYAAARARFGDGPVPRPAHWGGYRVRLDTIEFWQGCENRLHDRVRYSLQDDGSWSAQRLYP